jgi:predicted transcriptional regulator
MTSLRGHQRCKARKAGTQTSGSRIWPRAQASISELLALIRDRKPQSIAELVAMSGRAQPNLTHTLSKMQAAGLVKLKSAGGRKTPSVAIRKLVVEIDPFSNQDRLRVA